MKPETVLREICKGSVRFLAATMAISMILIGKHPDNRPVAVILLVGLFLSVMVGWWKSGE